jgi:Phospholipase_D-nuclease N-terminal
MILLAERAQPQLDPHIANVLIGMMIAVVVAYNVLWIWMLIDCVKNELPGSKQKTKWTIFIILFGPFGGICYSVGRRKQRIRERGQ